MTDIDRFRNYCGEETFARFIKALSGPATERGRLLFWQEQLIDAFDREAGISLPREFEVVRSEFSYEIERYRRSELENLAADSDRHLARVRAYMDQTRTLPGLKPSSHRAYVYLQQPKFSRAELRKTFDAIAAIAKSAGVEEGAWAEAGGRIVLPSGEKLEAVTYKTEHVRVAEIIRTWPEQTGRLSAQIVDGSVHVSDGRIFHLDEIEWSLT